jgi:hypothetical protein
MSNTSITYLVAAFAGVFSLAAYTVWVLVPAWDSYSRVWERIAAAFLSIYVLLAFAGIGVGLGAGFIWFYDRWF